ncbi:MAG TPA: hypothetical protein VM940_00860 [Chthoniobacterales bacterium]|nr:hypothetical protein [Chthoniobacterales bacterium]
MHPQFSRREEQRGNRSFDVLTDEESGRRIIVSRLGAERISVARRNSANEWVGFLKDDDDIKPPAKGWANHATVMGYYLHRIKNERTLYRGQEMRGGTHSFVRTKVWHAVPSDGENELIYRITPDDFSATEYPLNVSLDLRYRIEGGRIVVTFRFKNDEAELTAHVGFGLHPGFAAESFESFQFEMPAGLYRRYFSPGNYLTGETQEIQFAGGAMPFEREKLPGSYILQLVDVPEPVFVFSDPPTGRSVSMDLTGVPYLTLWSDGGPFLCVEPCWGLTDNSRAARL